MKKSLIATALLVLALITSGMAVASVTTITHSYGNGVGQLDPTGTDLLGNGYVTVAENSSTPFSDYFSLSNLGYSSINSLVLTLNYNNVGRYTTGESWIYHIGSKTVSSGWLAPTSGTSSKSKVYTFSEEYNATTFASMLEGQKLNFWFTEHSICINDFQLNLASLAVTGVQAVPEPEIYAMLMTGLVLTVTIARRRKN
jgi:hypothetical protein